MVGEMMMCAQMGMQAMGAQAAEAQALGAQVMGMQGTGIMGIVIQVAGAFMQVLSLGWCWICRGSIWGGRASQEASAGWYTFL